MAFLTGLELLAMGFKKVGQNCQISEKASIYGAKDISIGDNCRIDDFAILSGNIDIGNYVHIACHVSVIGRGKITLCDFTGLSGGTRLYSSSGDYTGEFLSNPTAPEEYLKITTKPVYIGKFVTIGAGSIILPGAIVGENSSIGALSLVRGEVPADCIMASNPMKFIRKRLRNSYELEQKLLNSKQSGK